MKVVLSGPPNAGKTTLLNALSTMFADSHVVIEPATLVIEQELELVRQHPSHEPRVPWLDYGTFGEAAVETSLALERQIPADCRLAFLDRSLADMVGYYRFHGLGHRIPEIKDLVRSARYSLVILCEPVGSYTLSDVRKESREDAARLGHLIEEGYAECEIPITRAPAMAVEERVALVVDAIAELH